MEKQHQGGNRLIFVGTGSSTGCPKPICSMLFGSLDHSVTSSSRGGQVTPLELTRLRREYHHRCHTSTLASRGGDPKHNKNYRNNPAIVLSVCSNDGEDCQNVIIDAGKTFREAGLRWFQERGIQSLDAIMLTHHHMDAAGGLDDVRGFQKLDFSGGGSNHNKYPEMVPMPLYLSQHCLDDVSQRFPWLFPKQQPSYKTGSETDKLAVERHVASFDINVFKPFQPVTVVKGLEILPLPVWHGDDLISYGFAFSLPSSSKNKKSTNVVYISDISKMIPETLKYIQQELPPTDILIVDALMPELPHAVHYSLKQAMELSEQLGATQTYFVGMNCDAFPPHDEINTTLQHKYAGMVVQLAYDGQVITL